MRSYERASLVALLIGAGLLGYPLSNVANEPMLLAGIPILYLYIFVVWVGLIAATWLLSRAPE